MYLANRPEPDIIAISFCGFPLPDFGRKQSRTLYIMDIKHEAPAANEVMGDRCRPQAISWLSAGISFIQERLYLPVVANPMQVPRQKCFLPDCLSSAFSRNVEHLIAAAPCRITVISTSNFSCFWYDDSTIHKVMNIILSWMTSRAQMPKNDTPSRNWNYFFQYDLLQNDRSNKLTIDNCWKLNVLSTETTIRFDKNKRMD